MSEQPNPPTPRACAWCAAETTRVFPPRGHPPTGVQIGTPEDAAAVAQPMLIGAAASSACCWHSTTSTEPSPSTTVSIGTGDHTFMAPREIYRDALLAGAQAIVVAHNYPSGDPTPSADDRQLTRPADPSRLDAGHRPHRPPGDRRPRVDQPGPPRRTVTGNLSFFLCIFLQERGGPR